jgi:hypothetical protein
MALQALAKYLDRAEAKAAADKAVAYLSKAQNGEGGYLSWGVENVESSAQVLTALCELGIPADDPRFVKNGHTLIDNILSYRNADGSFRHTPSGDGDLQNASEQSFCALVAAQRARGGKSSLYRMGDAAKRGDFPQAGAGGQPGGASAGLPGRHPDVRRIQATKPGATFADIAGHPGRAAIEALAARGAINGKADGKFDPDGAVTRAEFAKIATLILGLPERTEAIFTDVAAGQWHCSPVATAHRYGIVNGDGGGKFNPDGDITRQDAAVMVARAAKLAGMDTGLGADAVRDALSRFGDYRTVAGYAAEALAFCFGAGILDDGEFDIQPARPATRAEIAEMAYRLLEKAELL